MDLEVVRKKITQLGEIQPWNHNFNLAKGVQTRPGNFSSHGKNEVKLRRLAKLFDVIELEGKSVLDVGCNEGFFSFFMQSKGAVVKGIDIDDQRINKAKFIKSVIAEETTVTFDKVDIYSAQFKQLKKIDIVLCLGFLHRIPDPVQAIEAISEKTKMILFEWKALKHGPHTEAYAYFSPKNIDEEDYYGTEYWLLSYAALEKILLRQGFKYFYRVDDATQRRAILIAGKEHHKIFDLEDEVVPRNFFRILLRHSRDFIRLLFDILCGKVNS
jgi:SAM-dependent methyltransferase